MFAQKWIAVLAGTLIVAQASHACKLKVGWESWQPYQMKNDKGELVGIDIDIAKMVAEKSGCQVEFQDKPWARQLKELETGELDVVLAASKTPEREKFASYGFGYRNETVAFFVKAGEAKNIKVSKVADFKALSGKVGIMQDNSYSDEMDALIKANKDVFESANNESTNPKKLAAGRLIGFLADEFAGAYVIKSEKLTGQVEKHPFNVSSGPVYFIFSKAAAKSGNAEKWNKAASELKSSGKIDAILKQYSL